MFRSLYENFQNEAVQELNANIARYQSVEPNYTIFNTANNYSFPNSGIVSQELQSSNASLQNALNALGTVNIPGSTRGATEPTDITNLGSVLTGIPDDIGKSVKECRKYEGAQGLLKLMKDQPNPTALSRCGWRYQPGMGAVPIVAQAAFGNSSGPLDPARPQVDRVGNGVKYYWNLKEAEKQMVTDICKSATNCLDMAAVPVSAAGDFANLCGYCETSKKIIPIKLENGVATPRYNDLDNQCAPGNIIVASQAKQRCQPTPPGAPKPFYAKCLDANPLDRDCVTLSALIGGCSPEGTLIKALSGGKNSQDYADQLRNQKSFQTYQNLSKTPLSEEVIRQGNATIFAAVVNNYQLNRNMYDSDNEKRWVAALDLCRYGGIYDEWNFCDDLKDGDKDFDGKCMSRYFLQQGGTTEGSDFPARGKDTELKGNMTWGQYKESVNKLKERTQSRDPQIQSDALNRFSGLGLTYNPTNLPRGEASQGVEVFYFDTRRNVFLGRRPYQSAGGQNLPNFNVGGGEVEKTGLTDGVMMTYIFDVRPDNDLEMALGVVSDDGWAIAKNQSVFNIRDWSNGASWWYDQGPTWHNTSPFKISADDKKLPNIFMGAWYENGGGAAFHPFYKIGPAIYNRSGQPGWIEIGRGNTPSFPIDTFWKNNTYFTQEIDAPSLQLETYQPTGYFSGGLHFCDRRLWGAGPLVEQNRNATAQQAGYIFSKPNNTPLPAKQMILTLEDTRQWNITGAIAGSSIRTWVLCFNIGLLKKGRDYPWGDLIWMQPASGGSRQWGIRVYDVGSDARVNLTLVYSGYKGAKETRQIPIDTNKWYMAVVRLHPENLSSRAITKMSFFVQTLQNMKQGNVLTGTTLEEIPADNENHIFNDISRDRRDACRLILGTVHNGEQKKFHYAWVHGFDDVLDTGNIDAWKKEATKTWMGRWYE
jgi:hypothetical protein